MQTRKQLITIFVSHFHFQCMRDYTFNQFILSWKPKVQSYPPFCFCNADELSRCYRGIFQASQAPSTPGAKRTTLCLSASLD
jgi:hypothetical protein